MIIRSYRNDYEVVQCNSLDFLDDFRDMSYYYVIDSNVNKIYNLEQTIKNSNYIIIEPNEDNKTLKTASRIIDKLIELPSRKKTTLIAIGGGITQDICCFVASILYRGINVFLVPTTLLAQADSCIGSKSSINYRKYKNTLGTFYPPKKIFICPDFANSLSIKDYNSGLGEIAKIQIMSSKNDFYYFANNIDLVTKRDRTILLELIEKNLNYKKKLIELDEFDTGIRNILNYGHTFGHAIESTTCYEIPHGQAVSIGIIIANTISLQRKMIDEQYYNNINTTLNRIISDECKDKRLFDVDRIIDLMKMDKKYTGKHNCVLINNESVETVNDVSEEEIRSAIITGIQCLI